MARRSDAVELVGRVATSDCVSESDDAHLLVDNDRPARGSGIAGRQPIMKILTPDMVGLDQWAFYS